MKEINLAETITTKRREKGITQDALAAYVGVTKASVSKWETGQSYPDIALLPILAAYFDISIDDLMGYSPQMTESDIEKLYQRLALDFTTKPFEEVMADCEAITKKYYSCHLLLLRMAVLYINHANMAADPAISEQTIKQAIALCERAANSKSRGLAAGAANIQAMCHLSLNEGEKVLEILGENIQDYSPDSALIAQAYRILGNEDKSEEIFQADLYQNLMKTFQSLMINLQNNCSNLSIAEPIYKRAEQLATLFNMRQLLPNNMGIMYILGAQMYSANGLQSPAISALEKFVDVCINGFFPISISGDEFFDKITDFLAENATIAVRNEATVKQSMLEQLQSPVFADLQSYPEYTRLVNKLKNYIKGGN
ncbi:MAG: helix-turn-helix domain-containing protein [Defluviitaleaceae bacterium]|nr:helix-turn-helix domain-containing protein [Defluviitaleaceae bacterium]